MQGALTSHVKVYENLPETLSWVRTHGGATRWIRLHTVAILAQGTSWAVAVTQAFLPLFELRYNARRSQLLSYRRCAKLGKLIAKEIPIPDVFFWRRLMTIPGNTFVKQASTHLGFMKAHSVVE